MATYSANVLKGQERAVLIMANIELASYIVEFIKYFGGTNQALKAVQNTHAPYKLRKAEKLLKKLIRTYAYCK